MKVLVVYYSRTGSTRKVAEALARRCGDQAEIEEIRDARSRRGLLNGWWRSINEVRRRHETPIFPTAKRVEQYDLVALGTPVWASSMSSPLRTWLNRHSGSLKKIAVFVTQRGSGGENAISQVAEWCGMTPIASLIVNARDMDSTTYEQRLDEFAARLMGK